jgi:hypothetical protein
MFFVLALILSHLLSFLLGLVCMFLLLLFFALDEDEEKTVSPQFHKSREETEPKHL